MEGPSEAESRTSRLCKACSAIFSGERIGTSDDDDIEYDHHTTLAEFREAVAQKCPLCCRLFDKMSRQIDDWEQLDEGLDSSEPATSITLTPYNESFTVHGHLNLAQSFTRFVDAIINLFPWSDSPEMHPTSTIPASDDTGSTASWSSVSHWMADCVKSHERCSPSKYGSWYPTRLLDIAHEPGKFRIIESNSIPRGKEYITLSHRWGAGNNILKLHADRLNEFQAGMELGLLSRKYQDAIVIAGRLGVRYLWIDSLCIIQEGDDLRDWTQQAPTMKDVYINAMCNISADWAVSEGDGLFFKRDLGGFEPLNVQYQGRMWTLSYLDQMAAEVDDAPLNHRGWVAQERILANKCIHFCRRELFWECREWVVSESCPIMATKLGPDSPALSILPLKNPRGDYEPNCWGKQPRETGLWDDEANGLYAWHEAVDRYSRCDFTYINDKLVAISGVARQLQPFIKSRYLAGLWQKTLLTGVSWKRAPNVTVVRYNDDDQSISTTGTTPIQYYAPSFSWASSPYGVTPSLFHWRQKRVLASVSCVQATADEPVSEDVFGPLYSPSLRLKVTGLLRQAKLSFSLGSLFEVWVHPFTEETRSSGRLDFDVAPRQRSEFLKKVYYYIPLVEIDHERDGYHLLDLQVMFLELLDEPRFEYKRIGLVSQSDAEAKAALLADQKHPQPLAGIFDQELGSYTIYVV